MPEGSPASFTCGGARSVCHWMVMFVQEADSKDGLRVLAHTGLTKCSLMLPLPNYEPTAQVEAQLPGGGRFMAGGSLAVWFAGYFAFPIVRKLLAVSIVIRHA